MKQTKGALAAFASKARNMAGSAYTRAAGVGTGLMVAAGSAMAGSSPGQAIAGELSDGATQMGLVFSAVAILIGLLLVWSYIRRSAR